MRAILVLLVLGALGLAASHSVQITGLYTDAKGVVHTHCWGGCPSGPPPLPNSPAVKDALALGAAGKSTQAEAAINTTVAVLYRASSEPSAQAETLMRRRLPPLAATVESEAVSARHRLLAVDVQTTAGQTCRMALLHEIGLNESVYRTALRQLSDHRPIANVFSDFDAAGKAVHRAITRGMRLCLAGLQPDDRAAVKYIMGG